MVLRHVQYLGIMSYEYCLQLNLNIDTKFVFLCLRQALEGEIH